MSIVSREMTHDPMCPLRETVKRQQERIAQLEAELAEARRERDDACAQLAKVRHDRDEMIRVHDEVEAQRDAAQAELAEARREREQFAKRVKQDKAGDPCKHGIVFEQCASCLHEQLVYERDALHAYCDDLNRERATHERTKADTAAMRLRFQCPTTHPIHGERCLRPAGHIDDTRAALGGVCTWLPVQAEYADGFPSPFASTAGRDLAERIPLWRELERAVIEQDWRLMDGTIAQLAALDKAP